MTDRIATRERTSPGRSAGIIHFPLRASVRQVDAAWSAVGDAPTTRDLTVVLDVEGRLNAPTLVYLVSRLIERIAEESHTRVVLPPAGPAVDQLRLWNARSLFEDMRGSSFVSFENVDALDYRAPQHPQRSVDAAESLTFPLELRPRSARPFDEKLASYISSQWREEFVLSYLNRDLMGYGKRVSTHVVHEALMNVVRSPSARWLATCSSYDRVGRSLRRYLTAVIWDDGEAIYESLRRAMRAGADIQSSVPTRHNRTYRVRYGDQAERAQYFDSASTPSADAEDYEFLLAALYAGVTSDATRDGSALPEVVAQDPTYGQPGMGLFILANTVLDVFGGSLSIRTGSYHLLVGPTRTQDEGKQVDYDVQVTHHPGPAAFNGNMLTVQLPLGDLHAAHDIS